MRTDWKDRLNDWAPEPPFRAWERLSESLSQEVNPALVQKLQDLSAQPPAHVWKDIEASLDAEKVPVITLKPRQPWLRYAGMAAALLAVYFGVRNYTADDARPYVQKTTSAPQLKANDPKPKAAVPQAIASAALLPIETRSTEKFTPPPIPKIKSGKPLPNQNAAPVATSGVKSRIFTVPSFKVDGGLLERYIVVTTNEEAAVRLPKKVYDLFRCDDAQDAAACSERLTSLRLKAASPSLMAAADFTGLLEIIRNVETNK